MSMLAVASSINTTLLFFSIALQIQISCFSPELKFCPFSSICWYRLSWFLSIKFSREASFKSSINSGSEDLFSGSRLNLRVPSKRVGSWGMIAIFSLRFCKLIFKISTPSMNIWPEAASTILQRARQRVDLPAPVLPTTPIFWFACILNEMLFRTSSVSCLYFILKSLNLIKGLWIQF